MNAATFATGPAIHPRRVSIRRSGVAAWPWVVTIGRRDLPALVLPYQRFDEACEDVRYFLDLRRRLSVVAYGVQP